MRVNSQEKVVRWKTEYRALRLAKINLPHVCVSVGFESAELNCGHWFGVIRYFPSTQLLCCSRRDGDRDKGESQWMIKWSSFGGKERRHFIYEVLELPALD